MDAPPFDVRLELAGWDLFWAWLEVTPGGEEQLAALRERVVGRVRASFDSDALSSHPTIAALRALFRAAGCDPTRYRPSSEALLRRLLKGEPLPAIHPLVDVNNCLSAILGVPCCVVAEGTVSPPFVLRAGRPGESYESLRGPLNLEGKPLLADAEGPVDTPISGSQRVKVREGTRRALLTAYLPHGVVAPAAARDALAELLESTPGVRLIERVAASTAV
jgi:DNA/RNA-binding domain of Phe-tRNA-synthetase-like protein